MKFSASPDGILDFYPGANALGKVDAELLASLVSVRGAVGSRDWSAVQVSALHCLGLGSAAHQLCAFTSAGEAGRIAADLDTRSRLASTLDAMVAGHADLGSALATLVEHYAAAAPDTAAEFSTLIERLAGGTASGAEVIDALSNGRAAAATARSVTFTSMSAVAARLRGLLSLYHAEFNRQFSAASFQRQGVLDAADAVDAVMALHARQLASQLKGHLRTIQGDLAEASAVAAPSTSLDLLTHFLERELPLMARRQAVAAVATGELLQAGRGQDAERLGKRLAQVGLLVREAFASYAAAARVAAALRSVVPDPDIAALAQAAAALDFERALPNGRDTELSRLGDAPPDAFIEVSGFVERHQAIRLADGKLISRVTLLDPSSGARGDVVAVFVHLAHSGVTPGSFVRASGQFDRTPPGGGAPALQVDVLPLARLAERSFRIALYRIAEPFFEVWRNGANMTWSVGPHRLVDQGGEIDENASSYGAGELLFVPFIRT